MKRKKLTRKLELNKSTVSHLTEDQARDARGGTNSNYPACQTIDTCTRIVIVCQSVTLVCGHC